MRCLIALPLLLAGCAPDSETTNMDVDINAAATQAQNSIDNYAANSADRHAASLAKAAEPITAPAPGAPGSPPDNRTPVPEARFTPDSAQGAANVVQTYYALIGEKKYRRAWLLWDNGGKDSGMSAEAFAASFDEYSEYRAIVGPPGEIDAGAGQYYVTVPVEIHGRIKGDARPIRMIGSVMLHRTGDIDGATPAQKSWHIRSSDSKPGPKAG